MREERVMGKPPTGRLGSEEHHRGTLEGGPSRSTWMSGGGGLRGYAATWAGGYGAMGVRLRHPGLSARSTRIQFLWLQKPCGEPPPEKQKQSLQREEKKEREGKG